MKRLIITLLAIVTLAAPIAVTNGTAMAVDVFSNCGQNSANGTPDVCTDTSNQQGNTDASGNPTNSNPIINIIKQAITILSFIIGIGAVIGIVVSGIRMMTAGGSSEGIASARTALIYSLVGLAVAAIAQAIVAFVLSGVG